MLITLENDNVVEAVAVVGNPPAQFVATIANGAALSNQVNLFGRRPTRISLPAGWDAAALTFLTSTDGTNFRPLHDWNGSEVNLAAATMDTGGREIVLNPDLFTGVRAIQLRSGTAATPVNQTAQRAITINAV